MSTSLSHGYAFHGGTLVPMSVVFDAENYSAYLVTCLPEIHQHVGARYYPKRQLQYKVTLHQI